MKRVIRKMIAVGLIIMICMMSCAYADLVMVSSGSAQYALTIDKLALRSGPSTSYSELGTFKVKNEYVTVTGRCWDSVNDIWWLKCEFYYNGKTVNGWTGAKRFDSGSYDLYRLPEYEERYGNSGNYSNGYSNSGYGSWSQSAYAIQALSLRSGPSNKTTELGTFRVSGSWIDLTAKSWDSINNIWWVKCEFNYNGKRIIGWTGAKRFDSSSYDINALPEQ